MKSAGRDVVIVDSIRTGLAKSFRGSFNMTRPDDMAAHCIDAMFVRNSALNPAEVDDVVIGCSFPEGPQGMNMGRNVGILTKSGVDVPGMTLNRFCSSGLQSIAIAANQIASGCSEVIMAGGVESITMTHNQTNTQNITNPKIVETVPAIYMGMGLTAEVVAKRYGISREVQDELAALSQTRTAAAQDAGLFDDEISAMTVTYGVKDKETGEVSTHETTVNKDECNRPSTTVESLAGLKTVFDPDNGTVTAGNASQMSDGASMTMVMSLEKALALGLKPLAYFRGFVAAGCEPDEMGIGPVYAVPKLLKAKGMSLDDIDLVELNEAFAVQVAYCRDRLGIKTDRLNVNGGAISIGHPYGMSGSRMTGHIVRELQRQNKQFGLVTMCVGGGMGAAGLFEAYDG